jgi:ABC-2 type transport system permease protein
MNRISAFTSRNIKELLRDPLSYIFCLGFPILMLIIMSVVNTSIPPEAGMTVFRIDNLCGGIAMFGQTFVMLFTALTVSKDRGGSFLVRMYATPMTSADFTVGYILPMLIIAAAQSLITFVSGFIISLITGVSLSPDGMLVSLITLIPSSVLFIGLGLLFGTLFNDKAAPGLCSIIISLGSFLGNVFFDADNTGGIMLTICRCTPFYYCTKTARSAVHLDFGTESFLFPLIIVACSAALVILLATLVFKARMRADLS